MRTPLNNPAPQELTAGVGMSTDISEFVKKNRHVWQLKHSKRTYMPLSTGRIRRWISEGRVVEDTLVWRSGFAGWKKVSACDEFKDLFKKTSE